MQSTEAEQESPPWETPREITNGGEREAADKRVRTRDALRIPGEEEGGQTREGQSLEHG